MAPNLPLLVLEAQQLAVPGLSALDSKLPAEEEEQQQQQQQQEREREREREQEVVE